MGCQADETQAAPRKLGRKSYRRRRACVHICPLSIPVVGALSLTHVLSLPRSGKHGEMSADEKHLEPKTAAAARVGDEAFALRLSTSSKVCEEFKASNNAAL